MEWNPETAQFQCAVLYSPKHSHIEKKSVLNLIENGIFKIEEKENIIFAHYGGASDFLFLLRELVGKKSVYILEKEFYEVGGKIISFSIIYKGKKFQFRDSYAILYDGLDKLAQSFIGQKKIYDSSKLETKQEQLKQCFNDAKMLWEIIESFMNELNLEYLPLTYSSLAFSDMKKRCDFSKLIIQTKEDYEHFLPWFSGGHVDVYKRYSKSVFQYDIKSSYPFSQYNYGCPIGNFKMVSKRKQGKAGLYTISCNSKLYNPFLWYKYNSKLYFVNGQCWFYVTDIELDKLEELNIEYKILGGFEWNLDKDFFKDFVSYWFNYKERGGARRLIGKYMLNGGGYGKWAIKRNRDKIVFGNEAERFFSPDFNIGVKKEWVDFSYSQIHIASRITAGGRILLFEAQEAFKHEQLCYSDTDSVHVHDYAIREEQKFLGGLNFENSYNRGYWLGNKFYGLASDSEFKCILKGFPEKFYEENFKQALKGNLTFKYSKQKLLKFRSALSRSSDFVAIREFLREVKSLEIKRKLDSNGITTQPYFVTSNGELK
ncbi:DNA polymerase [Flavobacterium sp.]|uniref:DNA polymerase n=1 Tax=Flavobacterium sp. TaxID=239 RepID=UPI002B4ADAD2|nr:DNA polymerase [Flavobacterium sp.]